MSYQVSCLLEVEAKHYHLCACFLHAIRVLEQTLVAQLLGVLCVEGVAESVDELQLRTQLEVGQIEVAAHAELQRERRALQLQRVGALAREVDHRRYACHEIRAVVVEAWRSEDDVACHGDVGGLHILTLLVGSAALAQVLQVLEHYVARAEVHHRCHAQLEMCRQTQLAEHSDIDAGVPATLVGGDECLLRTVLSGDGHRTRHLHLHVLHVRTHDHAEVEWTQVGVRAVLHGALLS